MKKSEVNICDICQRLITDRKCEVCNKDICEMCKNDTIISMVNGSVLFYIITCKPCGEKLEKSALKRIFDEDVHKDIRKKIVKILKNAVLLENLEMSDEEKEKNRHMIWNRSARGHFKSLIPAARKFTKPKGFSLFKKSLKGGSI
jgi:hypothetical protein